MTRLNALFFAIAYSGNGMRLKENIMLSTTDITSFDTDYK
jgi:hypothetical protein